MNEDVNLHISTSLIPVNPVTAEPIEPAVTVPILPPEKVAPESAVVSTAPPA